MWKSVENTNNQHIHAIYCKLWMCGEKSYQQFLCRFYTK